jgi:hypothetical protein
MDRVGSVKHIVATGGYGPQQVSDKTLVWFIVYHHHSYYLQEVKHNTLLKQNLKETSGNSFTAFVLLVLHRALTHVMVESYDLH